ncbi:hypothetical protein L7E55_17295 [Pelotomaculum isophthalicicum JI]|uniref:Uncharacterized protein n=1 Tax=Pelotomaculum isophthalicicum JI TaxID=947010 RepID=A0A9X4JWU8_9FIRM|nr:hypothetical protein [Pelotomaculum isophthalicicum]MDF9410068.1 hypothetical protein [Pelotomaculum isophthalicicum JI]
MVFMIQSPKVKRHLKEIKSDKWTIEELSELINAIVHDFQIKVRIVGNADDEDFWALSPEEEQRFNDLLQKSTKDLKNKRYTEYSRPQA